MKISNLIKALYGLREDEKIPVIRRYLNELDEDERGELIDFYTESFNLLQDNTCRETENELRKRQTHFTAGSYSLTHQIGSYLVTGEIRSPHQDMEKPQKKTEKDKRKAKKKYRSTIYSKTKYRASLSKATTPDEKEEVINTFLEKRPDQKPVIDYFYHDIENLVVKEGVRKIKHVRGEYKSAPIADYEFDPMYMAGRVMHDLRPISISNRLQQANKSKNGKKELFTGREKSMQRRVSSAMFRGSAGGGHCTPVPPGYSDP